MAEDKTSLEHMVLTRLMRLNAMISGIVIGLLAGLVIFIATNWLLIKGGPVVGPHLWLLGQFLIGYKVTFAGSLVGFAYGFGGGFLVGYFTAKIYNWIADLRDGGASRGP